jgi:hypothetical protein
MPPLRRSSARSCATTPSSYGSLPTPCPTEWASTICLDCRVGCTLLPATCSPRKPSHPLWLKQTRDEGKFRRPVGVAKRARRTVSLNPLTEILQDY